MSPLKFTMEAWRQAQSGTMLGTFTIGFDSTTKIIRSAAATAANVADCHLLPDPLGDPCLGRDQGCRGQRKVIIGSLLVFCRGRHMNERGVDDRAGRDLESVRFEMPVLPMSQLRN